MNEKEKEKTHQKEKARNILLMGFDSAGSSFLALLVIEKCKNYKKSFPILIKCFKTFFVCLLLSSNPSAILKRFCWPVLFV